jgi:glycosyltransferase involved in cell wall biosynthesis
VPGALHIVTCRDPRSLSDHLTELRHTNLERRLLWPVTWWYEVSPWVREAVRQADAVFCPARCLKKKIRRLYGKSVDAQFVPSPVTLPDHVPIKGAEPTAIFVGRWDRRKRIERFFDLARRFPHVQFLAVGKAHDERYDQQLRREYGNLPNLEMPGFVSRFDQPGLDELDERAWILVNTSAREALPYTFVEATAWGCAILCNDDPDRFATRYGCLVADNDFAGGLTHLLENDRWRPLGARAAQETAATFREEASIDLHLQWYERLLGEKGPQIRRRRAA